MAAAPAQAAFGFDELMATLAQRKTGEARFAEERFVSGLDRTLNYTGTLSFSAPDRLERQTLTPRRESFVVEGNQLTLQRGERVRHLALDSVPELAAMVAAMRGTLSGDGSALRRYFNGHGRRRRRALDADPGAAGLSSARRGAAAAHRRHACRRARGRVAAGRWRPLGDDDRAGRA